MDQILNLSKQYGRHFKNPALLECLPFGDDFLVYDASTREPICGLAKTDNRDLRIILDSAYECSQSAFVSDHDGRRAAFKRWADLIAENKEDLALLISLEGGKLYKESLMEMESVIVGLRAYYDYMEGFSAKIAADENESNSKKFTTKLIPLGTTLAITPWNFPAAMVSRKLAPSLAVGCPVIIKPDHRTPLSCICLVDMCRKAGFPQNAVQIVLSDTPKETVEHLFRLSDDCVHMGIQRVSFTGSTAVGLHLHALAKWRPTCMEMGGMAPFIISDSCRDLSKAVDDLIKCRFRHSGQTCICANVAYVHMDLYEEFKVLLRTRLQEKFKRPGKALNPSTDNGPLIDDKAVERLAEQLNTINGTLIYQCKAYPIHGYPVTVIECAPPIDDVELFGPVLRIAKYTEKSDISQSKYGLAAYVYGGENVDSIVKMLSMRYGLVGVNTIDIVDPNAPFSGNRMSGLGVEGCPRMSVQECMRVCTIYKR